ncbi:MAG: hypothetical protein RMM16_02740 [Chloroherpetonaceae bacterium]|nr:hypothetical protein [Chloroherpetonaceae bacterium]
MNKIAVLFFVGLLLVGETRAQIIGESSGERVREGEFEPPTLRSFEIGLSQARFSPSTENDGEVKYFLNRPLLSFLFRQDNSLLYFDYSNRKVDGKSVGLNAFGAKFDFEFFLADYRQRLKPLIAISIVADLIQADRQDNIERDNPRLTSLALGGGGGFNVSTRAFILAAKAEAFVGFGTQGFSAAAGSAKGFLIDVAVQVPRLFGSYGFAFSYRLRHAISDYSENRYDYLFNINAFTAGIAF